MLGEGFDSEKIKISFLFRRGDFETRPVFYVFPISATLPTVSLSDVGKIGLNAMRFEKRPNFKAAFCTVKSCIVFNIALFLKYVFLL